MFYAVIDPDCCSFDPTSAARRPPRRGRHSPIGRRQRPPRASQPALGPALWLGGLLWLAAAGCAEPSGHVETAAGPAIAPDAEPAPPRQATRSGQEAMNTEFYLGTRADEQAGFAAYAKEIQALQAQASAKHEQPVQRGFHAKAHGCLKGELRPLADRDPRTRFGIFADGKGPYPVWVRFSNGVGWIQGDKELDARGLAVKAIGVPGKKYLDDETSTQDFLMTNSPTPVGKNAAEFMTFARANARGRLPGLFFLLAHPRTAGPALTKTGAIASAATETYWSGGAYHWGAHQTVKYLAAPCPGSPARKPSRKHPDYLRRDLIDAARGGLCFRFYVQFQVDPERTPIENASKEWTEKVSPRVPVADIVMPPQAIDSPAQMRFCQELAYSPWHAIAAHKPMGHINRARRYVYDASRRFRAGGREPTGQESFAAR